LHHRRKLCGHGLPVTAVVLLKMPVDAIGGFISAVVAMSSVVRPRTYVLGYVFPND
jgi:hypothetical protein